MVYLSPSGHYRAAVGTGLNAVLKTAQPERSQDHPGVWALGLSVFSGNGLKGRPPGYFFTISTLPQANAPVNLGSFNEDELNYFCPRFSRTADQ
jgi:hypothetical protein